MTIREAIDRTDGLKPNQYSDDSKVKWLSNLDHSIHINVLETHELNDGETLNPFVPYSVDDTAKELLVPAPYDEVYIAFLKLKIDENNQETARYNNSVALYNSYFAEFENHYQRTHKPIKKASFSFWG